MMVTLTLWGTFIFLEIKDSYTVTMPTISYKQQCGGMRVLFLKSI